MEHPNSENDFYKRNCFHVDHDTRVLDRDTSRRRHGEPSDLNCNAHRAECVRIHTCRGISGRRRHEYPRNNSSLVTVVDHRSFVYCFLCQKDMISQRRHGQPATCGPTNFAPAKLKRKRQRNDNEMKEVGDLVTRETKPRHVSVSLCFFTCTCLSPSFVAVLV